MANTILHVKAFEYDNGTFEVTRPITEEEHELIKPLIEALKNKGHETYNFSTYLDSEWDMGEKTYHNYPKMYREYPDISRKAIDFMVLDVFKRVSINGIISIDIWNVEVVEENKFLDWYDIDDEEEE